MSPVDLGGMAFLGLAGSTHCLGMCGGFVVCLQGRARQAGRSILAWHAGRILTYTALGALLGILGLAARAQWEQAGGRIALLMAGSFMALAGLALLGLGPRTLETLGRGLPLAGRLAALLQKTSVASALALGAFTGFLPCGLLYAALVRAAASASPAEGAVLMLAFALGTTPALLGLSVLGPLLRGRMMAWWPRLAGVAALGFGLVTIWAGLGPVDSSNPHCHGR